MNDSIRKTTRILLKFLPERMLTIFRFQQTQLPTVGSGARVGIGDTLWIRAFVPQELMALEAAFHL